MAKTVKILKLDHEYIIGIVDYDSLDEIIDEVDLGTIRVEYPMSITYRFDDTSERYHIEVTIYDPMSCDSFADIARHKIINPSNPTEDVELHYLKCAEMEYDLKQVHVEEISENTKVELKTMLEKFEVDKDEYN